MEGESGDAEAGKLTPYAIQNVHVSVHTDRQTDTKTGLLAFAK